MVSGHAQQVEKASEGLQDRTGIICAGGYCRRDCLYQAKTKTPFIFWYAAAAQAACSCPVSKSKELKAQSCSFRFIAAVGFLPPADRDKILFFLEALRS